MELQEIISDVCRAKNDLAALAVDESVTPERFAKCEAATSNLETIVGELLTEAWVPRDPAELLAAIQRTNKNLQRVQADVASVLDVVLPERRPDEFYRVWIAFSFARLLEFQLEVLMTALVTCMKCPCGCGAFVPSGWIN